MRELTQIEEDAVTGGIWKAVLAMAAYEYVIKPMAEGFAAGVSDGNQTVDGPSS